MPATMPTINPLALLVILGLFGAVVLAWIWAVLQFAFSGRVVPRFDPHVVPWGGKSVLAALVGWLAIQMLVLSLFLFATRGTFARPREGQLPLTPAEMMTNSALQNAVVLVLIPALLAVTARARPRDFVRLDRRSGWQVLQGMLAWPLATPMVYGAMLLAVRIWGKESHPLENAIRGDAAGSKAIIFLVAGVILAPMAEELIFRGVLLGWLDRLILGPRPGVDIAQDVHDEAPSIAQPEADEVSAVGLDAGDDDRLDPLPLDQQDRPVDDPYTPPRSELNSGGDVALAAEPRLRGRAAAYLWLANIGVSLLFATLHYTVWPTPVPIFFLSLVLGMLYQRTGSLVAPVALHMTFNGISTALMFLTLGASPEPKPAPTSPLPAPIPKPVDPITKPAVNLEAAPPGFAPD